MWSRDPEMIFFFLFLFTFRCTWWTQRMCQSHVAPPPSSTPSPCCTSTTTPTSYWRDTRTWWCGPAAATDICFRWMWGWIKKARTVTFPPIRICIKSREDDSKNGHLLTDHRALLRAWSWSVHTVELRARMNTKCCFFLLLNKISCFFKCSDSTLPNGGCLVLSQQWNPTIYIYIYVHLGSFLMAVLIQSYQMNEI